MGVIYFVLFALRALFRLRLLFASRYLASLLFASLLFTSCYLPFGRYLLRVIYCY